MDFCCCSGNEKARLRLRRSEAGSLFHLSYLVTPELGVVHPLALVTVQESSMLHLRGQAVTIQRRSFCGVGRAHQSILGPYISDIIAKLDFLYFYYRNTSILESVRNGELYGSSAAILWYQRRVYIETSRGLESFEYLPWNVSPIGCHNQDSIVLVHLFFVQWRQKLGQKGCLSSLKSFEMVFRAHFQVKRDG